eukprot:6354935-Amphidinium_carterae.1
MLCLRGVGEHHGQTSVWFGSICGSLLRVLPYGTAIDLLAIRVDVMQIGTEWHHKFVRTWINTNVTILSGQLIAAIHVPSAIGPVEARSPNMHCHVNMEAWVAQKAIAPLDRPHASLKS